MARRFVSEAITPVAQTMDTRRMARGEPGPMKPAETLDHPFEHPCYWSAFILIGDPS